MKKKLKKDFTLPIISALIILAGGIFLGCLLRSQKLMITPAEQQVIDMKLKDAIDKKNALFSQGTVLLSQNDQLGQFLTAANGMTLYVFKNDEPGISQCNDACILNWPPLTVEGNLMAGEGISGALNLIERADGSRQVAYNDQPLYFWINDKAPGDTTGQGVNDVWFVVQP